MELSNWRKKLLDGEERMSTLAQSPKVQAALAAELEMFCASDEDDQDIEMIGDENYSPTFGALRAFSSRSASPVNARSRSPRCFTGAEHFPEVEQRPPSGPKLARPRSAVTGRRLPANQAGTCSSSAIQVGSLLPQ